MNQSAGKNSIFGWVKNLKRNTLLSDSIDEVNDDLSVPESKSPTRTSFQLALPMSPLKDKSPHHAQQSPLGWTSAGSGAPDFLRPLLSHKSRSTNNVNQSSSMITQTLSNQDSSLVRQRRDSFLQNNPLIDENSTYFGVPLADAIKQANARISILGSASAGENDDDVLHYGRIPIVVAKCGAFLKQNGLNVEGIFRVGGASKRIKELQIIFNTPPEFGKRLSWDGFTVHDAASILRRYLNALPEPLIPLDLYEDFRDPLRSRPRIIKYLKYKAENPSKPIGPQNASEITISSKPATLATAGEPSESLNNVSKANDTMLSEEKADDEAHAHTYLTLAGLRTSSKPKSYKKLTKDVYAAIDDLRQLLEDLPCLSKQLLFYILDLLAMVQSYSGENLMSSRNLAAIFQPSILSHPNHDMDPEEYALSQCVVEFLIHYSYKLLPTNEIKGEARLPAPLPSPKLLSEALPASQPKLQPRRNHSQSLSAKHNDIDLIGYRKGGDTAKNGALSDAEHDFGSASSDEDANFEKLMQKSWPLPSQTEDQPNAANEGPPDATGNTWHEVATAPT